MDIMELGAIGELVGGVAVIASLIYVGLQVRQGNRLLTHAAVSTAQRATNEFQSELAKDPELMQLYLTGLGGRDTLSTEDRLRFDMLFLSVLRQHERMFFDYEDGHVTQEVWGCYDRAMTPLFRQSGGLASWRRQARLLTERYGRYVDRHFIADAAEA